MSQDIENKKTYIETVKRLLLTVLAFLATHCKMQVISGEGSNFIGSFLEKLSESFWYYPAIDILTFVGIYLLILYVSEYAKKANIGINIPFAILAGYFSLSFVLLTSYRNYYTDAFLAENKYQLCLSAVCIVGYFILFYYLLSLLSVLFTKNESYIFRSKGPDEDKNKIEEMSYKRCILCGFLIIMACWLPWMVMNYPGSFCPDSVEQLMQLHGGNFSALHPPLATLMMNGMVEFGALIIDRNFGVFLYIIIRSAICAWIFAVGFAKLREMGLSFKCCLVGILFFSLVPLWGAFSQWFEKDFFYTGITVLFLINLIDVFNKRECSRGDAVKIVLVGVLVVLLRHNGLYAIVPTLIVLAFYFKGKSRARTWISLAAVMLVYLLSTKFIYPVALNISEGSVKEALSIPFQQTACYVQRYEDDVTEEEEEIINDVLNYSVIGKYYYPVKAAKVKDTYVKCDSKEESNARLMRYFGAWFKMFFKHPDAYIDAFWSICYGYLAPVDTHVAAEITMDYNDDYEFLQEIGIHRVFGNMPTELILDVRAMSTTLPLLHYFAMPGLYTWIILLCLAIVLKKRDFWALIIFIPEIITILVCVASPVGNNMRYALPYVASTPFIAGWTAIRHNISEKKR